jgi:hypothetical protein
MKMVMKMMKYQTLSRVVEGKTQYISGCIDYPSVWRDTHYSYMQYKAIANEREYAKRTHIKVLVSVGGYNVVDTEGVVEYLNYKNFDIKYPEYAGKHYEFYEGIEIKESGYGTGDAGFFFPQDRISSVTGTYSIRPDGTFIKKL